MFCSGHVDHQEVEEWKVVALKTSFLRGDNVVPTPPGKAPAPQKVNTLILLIASRADWVRDKAGHTNFLRWARRSLGG